MACASRQVTYADCSKFSGAVWARAAPADSSSAAASEPARAMVLMTSLTCCWRRRLRRRGSRPRRRSGRRRPLARSCRPSPGRCRCQPRRRRSRPSRAWSGAGRRPPAGTRPRQPPRFLSTSSFSLFYSYSRRRGVRLVPFLVGVEERDLGGALRRLGTQVALVDVAALIDDEGHDAGLAVPDRPGDDTEAGAHAAAEQVAVGATLGIGTLAVEQAVAIAVIAVALG